MEVSHPHSLFGGPTEADPNQGPLGTITEQEPEGRVGTPAEVERTTVPGSGPAQLEMKPEHILPHPQTPVRQSAATGRQELWPEDVGQSRALADEGEILGTKKHREDEREMSSEWGLPPKTPEQDKPNLKPSLRRTPRSGSGNLRAAAEEAAEQPQPPSPPSDLPLERIASSSAYDPVTDKGKRPVRGMADVYVS